MRHLKTALIMGMLVLCVLPAGAASKPGLVFGIHSGWSFNIGKIFIDMNSGGHTDNHYLPNFCVGLYGQYDFSPRFGLQLSVACQNFSNRWRFHYYDRFEEGEESLAGLSVTLNGVATVARSAMSEFYLLAGGGFLKSSFLNLGTLLQVCAGPGVKLRLKPGSSTMANFGALLHHVMYKYGKARHADYVRLQAGLEFHL
jgi:hypothetical protein